MNEDVLSKLNDIKELEKIPDNSLFIFSALILLGFIFLLILIFFITKLIKNRVIFRYGYHFLLEKTIIKVLIKVLRPN